ncbi:MAG: sodium-independent anion transporter [Gammaproteobacteria bacterium]|nr:sodium-independent anion transporter [Gammaproteobacteria bacterium]|tara:strand:+ start:5025 stop:6737 length:1713 start_codon:yes stop_codon:yes gene_type:complete
MAARYFPVLSWARSYTAHQFSDDLLASVIVMVMLVPQSLAYAMLAGLPAEMGLYASILPLVAYTVFGTSRALSVGPVAVISLMTAAAISGLGLTDPAQIVSAAMTLALMSGLFLVLMGVLRLGFLANFLSHPVIAGFITASGVLIALGQVPAILGLNATGHNLPEQVFALAAAISANWPALNMPTVMTGVATLVYLFWARSRLAPILRRVGMSDRGAVIVARLSPVVAVLASGLAAWYFDLGERGLALVGDVPAGLPVPGLPAFQSIPWMSLAGPALLIAILGFVESVSVAQGLAARKRQRIDPDQELIGLGASNLAAGFSGGFPVAGGFARSVVNFDAGAATPAAGLFAAILIAAATFVLMPLLAFLPKATLAATIIVAVWSLVDISIVSKAWRYSRADFLAVTATIVLTLLVGVEAGVAAGILVSVLVHLYKSSRPHVAIVGQIPGSEHFRNVVRHQVITHPHILSLRVDESLYFANTRYLEDLIYKEVSERNDLQHVILMCSAVNEIDLSALESLEAINRRLDDLGIKLHLSEVKGPVMDALQKSHFLHDLSGQVYLSQHLAVQDLV